MERYLEGVYIIPCQERKINVGQTGCPKKHDARKMTGFNDFMYPTNPRSWKTALK
jgi:hypothetical protein